MAEGWFRATGKVGAFHVGAGPGLANTVCGVMSAYTCGSGIIGISGQTHSDFWGRNAMQEIQGKTYAEGHRILEPIVKRYWQVSNSQKITDVLDQAYSAALTGRPGPVLIDVAMDLFEKECEVDDPRVGNHRPTGMPAGDPDAVQQAFELLLESKAPVMLCGRGVVASEAWAEAIEIAERFSIPVVTTFNGKSAIPADHPLAVGPIGVPGNATANETVRESDLVLALGTRFTEWSTSSWKPGLPFDFSTARLIQVDIVPDEIGRHYPVTVGIQGHLKHVLRSWVEIARSCDSASSHAVASERIKRIQAARDEERQRLRRWDSCNDVPIRPERVLGELRELLSRDAIVMPDAGNHSGFFQNSWDVYEPKTYINDNGVHAMGYAPAAALGVKLGCPQQEVVVVTGDGSMTQVNWVLATAAEYNIPVKFVVLNNSALGSMVGVQENAFDGRVLCTKFTDHSSGEPYVQDFSLLAKSYNVMSSRVTEPSDIKPAIDVMLNAHGPYLLEIMSELYASPEGAGAMWVSAKSWQ
jgi:acetolactate synthase-1/2/3 large subunit